MKKELGNMIWFSAAALACTVAANLLLPSTALARSAEPPIPATTTAQAQPVAGPLVVINKPIFAAPKAGSLLVSANPHPADGSIVASGVKRFRIVFPPAAGGGTLSLAGSAKSPQAGWHLRRWYKTRDIGTAAARLAIRWQPARNEMGSTPPPIRAAHIIVVGATGTVRITADSVLGPGGRGIGHGRTALELVVVDVRLQNGRDERIQFLPVVPPDRTVFLGPSTPSKTPVRVPQELAVAGAVPQLSPVVKAFRARNGEIFHMLGQGTSTDGRIKAVWVNLFGDAHPERKPVAGKMGRLEFSLGGGRINNNYARDARLASLYTAQLHSDLASLSKEQSAGDYSAKRLEREAKNLLTIIAARSNRLRALRLIALRVELYPGGPVLETVTYTRPRATTQPGTPRPIETQPVGKKHGPAAGF